MIPEAVQQQLAGAINTLRIIVLSLANGLFIFGLLAFYQNQGKAVHWGTEINPLLLGLGLLNLVLGLVIPRLIQPSRPVQVIPLPEPAAPSDEERLLSRCVAILSQIQTRTIIACALFEGGAFANIYWYYTHQELAHLAIAGVLFSAILLHFPRKSAIFQEIETRIRQEDEDSLLGPR